MEHEDTLEVRSFDRDEALTPVTHETEYRRLADALDEQPEVRYRAYR